MIEWKEYKLNDLVTKLGDGLHGTPKYDPNGDYYFINGSNLINGKISVNENTKKVTKEEFEKYKKELTNRTIFVSINGTLGNIALYNDEKVVLGKSACYFNIKEDVSKEFIKYIVTDHSFQHYIYEYATGSTIKNVPLKAIREYTFKLPDLQTQTSIAEILSSLDDKIELNNKINQELETLAQTLFKQWFIDFEFPNENGEPYKSCGGEMVESELGEIPKSWEVTRISTLDYKLQTGTRPKGGVGGITSGVPSIGAESVKGLGYYDFSKIKYVSNEFASKMKRGKVEGYELLIYKDGGKPGTFMPHFSMFGEGFPFETFFINEHVFLLDFFDKEFNSFCYFYFDSKYVTPVFENNGGKAAIPGINQEDVKNLLIFRPDNEIVKIFGEFAKSSITTILKNCKENIQLSNLRNELLPKLISGELEINEINN